VRAYLTICVCRRLFEFLIIKCYAHTNPLSRFSLHKNLNSLAPPTRQSLKCIQLHNFGLVGPNFTNLVPLESLDHDESNVYDVNFRLTRFYAILDFVQNLKKFSAVTDFDRFSRKLAQSIFGPIRTKVMRRIFQFQVCSPTITNQSWRQLRQTGSEAISQQPFDLLTSNF